MRVKLISFAVTIFLALADAEGAPASSGAARPPGALQPLRPAEAENRGNELAMANLVFPGGTVRELIQTLKETARKAGLPELNVIVPDNMQTEEVPPFELHHVNYGDVFRALSLMQTNRWIQSGGAGGAEIWLLLEAPKHPAPAPMDPLTGLPLTPPARICQIYSLNRYLGKYHLEDITTAIQTAWSMMDAEKSAQNGEKGAQLKYHKDTSLLIAVGSPQQLGVIEKVLHSLEDGMAPAALAAKLPAEVLVTGAVNKPGAVALPSSGEDLNIIGAIARAGGLSTRANENKIKLTRLGVLEKTFRLEDLKTNRNSNLLLKSGDIIEVGEKLF